MPLDWPYCATCVRRRIVPGVGRLPNRWLFLGEGPGWEEHKYLEPFVGKSGRELNFQYLPMSGIGRQEIRIDNVMKCMPRGERPDPDEIECCSNKFLPGILRECQPEVIVTMGAFALSCFGDYSLELEHGYPIYNASYGDIWQGTLFPCYHPAAGLHTSSYMIQIQEDFYNLGLFRHGKLVKPVDEFPNPDYRVLSTPDDVRSVIRVAQDKLGPNTHLWKVGTDTEYIGQTAFCQTFSFLPGTGYLMLADNPDVWRTFSTWARTADPFFLFHNWFADCDKVRQMGMDFPYRWKDTMNDSYHLGTTPQALKELCYRLCGMLMQDYEDLVYPIARPDMEKWLLTASSELQSFIDDLPWKTKLASCSGGGKGHKKHESLKLPFDTPGTKPCPACGKLKTSGKMEKDKGGRTFPWNRAGKILSDTLTNPATNPFKRWLNVNDTDRLYLEQTHGQPPRPTIDRAFRHDPEATTRYACRDSDGTLRIEPKLVLRGKQMERRVRKGELL